MIESSGTGGRKEKILVVDDEPRVVRLVSEVLKVTSCCPAARMAMQSAGVYASSRMCPSSC
jgi:CheY-like chemotaxis protein